MGTSIPLMGKHLQNFRVYGVRLRAASKEQTGGYCNMDVEGLLWSGNLVCVPEQQPWRFRDNLRHSLSMLDITILSSMFRVSEAGPEPLSE